MSEQPKIVGVAIMGREVENIAVNAEMSVDDIAKNLGVAYDKVEAKTTKGGFKEVKGADKVALFTTLLFTPKVDGGKTN